MLWYDLLYCSFDVFYGGNGVLSFIFLKVFSLFFKGFEKVMRQRNEADLVPRRAESDAARAQPGYRADTKSHTSRTTAVQKSAVPSNGWPYCSSSKLPQRVAADPQRKHIKRPPEDPPAPPIANNTVTNEPLPEPVPAREMFQIGLEHPAFTVPETTVENETTIEPKGHPTAVVDQSMKEDDILDDFFKFASNGNLAVIKKTFTNN